MRKIYFILLISALSLTGHGLFSQDIHFTQYYSNPCYLNPAFAGTGICPRLNMNYRNQWPAVPGTYVSYSASYDQHIESLSGGIGLMFNADDAGEGTLKTNIVSAIYSYRLEVNRHFSIKMGLQASYFQKKLDWSKLTFNDMIDPRYGFVYNTNDKANRETTGGADFSAGILAYGEKFFAGFAVHHLTQPNEAFISVSKLPRRYTFHAGGIIDLKHGRKRRSIEDPYISPNILFMKQQDFEELNYGMYFSKYPLVGGIWFRQGFDNPDAFIALLGIQTAVFKLGYSYDVTVSKLGSATAGSHEISAGFQFDCKPKKKRIRAIMCPSF
jgi:type IX secretion system PorP/SprF family membrane protein